MTHRERWAYRFLMLIGVSLTLSFGIWWFNPVHVPQNFSGWLHALDILAFALLSYVVWYQICYELFSWHIARFMRLPKRVRAPEKGLKVALLTAFVPGKEPYDLLERTLQAMVNVEYKHDTWVLDEGDDARVKKLCRAYGAKHYSRKGKRHHNTKEGRFKARTKAGNYNSWFEQHAHKYDFVAQHDVDFIPKKEFLTRTLGYFSDPSVAFVGTPQIYGNKDESWIARGAAEQAYGFYGHVQRGLHGHDMSLFIGANHIVRVAAHDHIEGYSGHIVEDHLTGMKFYAHKWKSVYVPEILAIGEGPSTWESYFGQQMRWAYGLMDILFRHSPRLFFRMELRHMFNYFLLQQYYFYGIAQAIGVALMSLYFFFGFQSTSMELMPLFTLYVPLLAFQIVVFFWMQRFNIDQIEERGFLWRGRLLNLAVWPVYFIAFIGALVGKKMSYKVTPKGDSAVSLTRLSLFYPHILLGTISFVGILAGLKNNHDAPQILFWAIINAVAMYGLFLSVLFQPSGRLRALLSVSTLIHILSFIGINRRVFRTREVYSSDR